VPIPPSPPSPSGSPHPALGTALEATPKRAIPAFINPAAGSAREAADALAKVGGFLIEEVDAVELERRVHAAVNDGAERVLVAGGDGSITSAASALCGAHCELAILPAGTLNHLARDLGLPEDLAEAAQLATGPHVATIDMARVSGRIFLNTSSVGAYVTFVRTRERLERRLGYRIASLIAALRILATLRSFRVTVEVEGVKRSYDTPLVFIGVGERELKVPALGKRIANGRHGLHVMIVRSRSGARVLALALAAMARGVAAVARTPAMDSFIVDRLRIEPHQRLSQARVAVDGEIVTVSAPLVYELVHDAVTVVVGPPRDEPRPALREERTSSVAKAGD
jgi:diacylglycerol kinase family enzyme